MEKRSLSIDLCYCGDGNPLLQSIAREEGWHLGFRSDGSFTFPDPLLIDIDYKKPNFERHLEAVKRYRPKYATVTDLSDKEVSQTDIARAIEQAERLQPYCEIVLIVPKLSGQVDLLPPSTCIGYSVPSRYGGAQYPSWELSERRVHLLGGSPRKQFNAYLHLSAIATVTSVDGNYAHAQAINFAMYWKRNQWHYHPLKNSGAKDLYQECWRWSCQNLMEAWKRIA